MKKLTYARRLAVQDAIFWGQISKLHKETLLAELLADKRLQELTVSYLEALKVLKTTLGRDLSDAKARKLIDGTIRVDDLYSGKEIN